VPRVRRIPEVRVERDHAFLFDSIGNQRIERTSPATNLPLRNICDGEPAK
jgi:hypothetical protein